MKKSRIQVIVTIAVLLVLLCVAVYLIVQELVMPEISEEPPTEVNDPKIYPEGYIPTYEELEEAMGRAAEDLFGEDWEEKAIKETEDFYSVFIPQSNTSVDLSSVTDDRTLMATVVAAYYNNPYMITKETPAVYSLISPQVGEAVKELPNGGTIDLSTVVEEYTSMRFMVDRDNPFLVGLDGYRDGNYFEHDVDLEDLFKTYY